MAKAQQHGIDVKIETATDGQVIVEDGAFVANAAFQREGADLFLTSPDGRTVMIEGYFNQTPPPDIMTKDGARLTPELVDAFLPPQHPGQYAAATPVATDASPAGHITKIQGDAVVIHADGTKTPATTGMAVVAGDVIQTSAKGAVNILFTDNSSFAVSENARLSIDEYVFNAQDESGSTFFSLLQGVFVYTSGLIGKHDASSVNIETPVGSIGIRGTVVAGEIAPAGQESTITIVDGAIVVSNTGGALMLNSGFQTATLTSSTEAPTDGGQISVAAFSQTYQSVSAVATETFIQLDSFAAQAAAAGSPVPANEAAPAGEAPPAPAGNNAPAEGAAQPGTTSEAAPAGDAGIVDVTVAAPESSTTFGTLLSASDAGGGDTTMGNPPPLSFNPVPIPPPPPPMADGPKYPTQGATTPDANTPVFIAPEVHFDFAPFYLHGTPSKTDDGLPLFMQNMGGIVPATFGNGVVVGQVVGSNLPADAVFTVTGEFNGNVVQYYDATGATNPNDTMIVASQPVFHYDAATRQLILDNPWAILPDLNPGGFHFTVTATSASAPQSNTSSNFVVIYDDMGIHGVITAPGAQNPNIVIGDQTAGDANPSVSTAENDMNLGLGAQGGANTGPDIIIGRGGNDVIFGSAGEGDTLLGGDGNDIIQVSNSAFHLVDGGVGGDTLILGQGMGGSMTGALDIDFTLDTAPLVRNIESIDLGLSATNVGSRIRLNIQDVFEMTTPDGGGDYNLYIVANPAAIAVSSAVDLVMNSAAGNFVLDAADTLGVSDVLHYTGTLASNGATVTLVITETATPGATGGITVTQV